MVQKFAKPFSMDNARTPKVLAPKARISAAQWFEENAFVGCRDMEPANVGRRFRHDGAQREKRALLLGRMRRDPWTEPTVSCHGWRISMRGLTRHCPKPLSFVVGRPYQWIGCSIAVMIYLMASVSNHCMSNCSQCVSLQQPWTALPRAGLERFHVILAMGAHHPDR